MNKLSPEIDTIREQVLQNCAISDAHHAGLYSICGLALRLRDLFKWEMGLDPWEEKESSELLEWIGEKEEDWERVAEKEFQDITLHGKTFDPLDLAGINSFLEPKGLLYGAGYVQSLKPTFFLAALEEKRKENGHNIYLLGKEFARDIMTLPALSQDNNVFLRRESAMLFLWDKILFLNKSGRKALSLGLESYGVDEKEPDSLRQNLERISRAELETYLYHEIGEMEDTVFDRQIWREIVSTFPFSPIELLSRTLKDIIADTNPQGRLMHIIGEKKTASLAFYVAFLDGMRKELFPEIFDAFLDFARTGNWGVIGQAVSEAFANAKRNVEGLIRIFSKGKDRGDMTLVEKEIEETLLVPLGIRREA